MSQSIRVIQFGLGPIGSAVARHVLERPGVELVGAVDIAPAKVGKDTGEVLGLEKKLGIPVSGSLAEALAHARADVVTHCTGSYADHFTAQILEILGAGLSIVSTSEELSFPWLAHPAEAKLIDDAAKHAGRAVLATGVNPSFLMDTLPLTLTAICQRVDHITVTRTQNASNRRGPFQAKIGSGMTIDEFTAKMAAGRMGHVGLVESAGMVLTTLGKRMVKFETSVEPVVAEKPVTTPYFDVAAGRVRGLRQVAHAYAPEGEFLTLVFVAALDEATDQDVVVIEGKPNLEVTLKGTNGDIATVAITVNAIRRVLVAQPGLATMADLPLVAAW
jgi:2,4-diaminopentanoate dehydrogenase